MKKGSSTRSGLLWEVERLLNEMVELPQVLMMENVTQVHNKRNIDDFKQWICFLESKGYSNYYADLNAIDYGIPQNRNRCYMISILGDEQYEFPEPIKAKRVALDFLEDVVDDKYFLSDRAINGHLHHASELQQKGYGNMFKPRERERVDKYFTITTKAGNRVGDNYIIESQSNID